MGFIREMDLGKFDHELTTSEAWKSWFISPFMAARFRLVNYYNLPRMDGGMAWRKLRPSNHRTCWKWMEMEKL